MDIIIIVFACMSVLTAVAGSAFAFDSMAFDQKIGIIEVCGGTAVVNMDGVDYVILSENNLYAQFEGRLIKMYRVKVINRDGTRVIDFEAFRLIDAFA